MQLFLLMGRATLLEMHGDAQAGNPLAHLGGRFLRITELPVGDAQNRAHGFGLVENLSQQIAGGSLSKSFFGGPKSGKRPGLQGFFGGRLRGNPRSLAPRLFEGRAFDFQGQRGFPGLERLRERFRDSGPELFEGRAFDFQGLADRLPDDLRDLLSDLPFNLEDSESGPAPPEMVKWSPPTRTPPSSVGSKPKTVIMPDRGFTAAPCSSITAPDSEATVNGPANPEIQTFWPT